MARREVVQKEAQLMDIDKPQFLTLTKHPANRSGFKILRSDGTGTTKARKKRTEHSGLLAIVLPSGLSDEQIDDIVDGFNLGDAYSIQQYDDNTKILTRSDVTVADGFNDAVPISFNGYMAYLDPQNLTMRSDEKDKEPTDPTGVTLVWVEFDGQIGDEEAVNEWLSSRSIGGSSSDLQILEEGGAIYTLHEPSADIPVRKVRLDDGVYGYVAPSESDDIPSSVYRSIVETAYGSWGWGSVDFVQAISDREFSEMISEARYMLNEVLDSILYYSELTLDARKTLVQNATSSYAAYITGLIDSLPRDAVQRDAKRNTPIGDTDMTTDTKVSDDKTKTETEDNKDFVTRSELASAIEQAVSAAFESHKPAEGEAESKDTAAAARSEADASDGGDKVDTNAVVLKAVADLADDMKKAMAEEIGKVSRSVKSVQDEVDDLSGTTIQRDSGEDADTTEEAVDTQPKSVFRGMFGNKFAA